ncbi:MAG: phosphoribosylamine--glycine ligase [Neisseriaceae bacterium]
MKILVVGAGAREHALAWKLAASPKVDQVFVAPGNGGTVKEKKVKNIPITEIEALVEFCQKEVVDLTVVGPEAPLAAGIVDIFEKAKLKIFGPTKAAARLESSKSYAKQLMKKYGIPTARYELFEDLKEARAYISRKQLPIVLKLDGLAAGKGVVVANSLTEAYKTLEKMLAQKGNRVLIEDFLPGVEASFIVMVDGSHILPLASSQDYKRLLEQDKGPNTGGMGAYSPTVRVSETVFEKTMETIVKPIVDALAKEGCPFKGFLYAGLMIDKDQKPHTVEFNCRLGDPETEPILMRLQSDLVDLLEAACEGRLHQCEAKWDTRTAVAVVLAAQNYPQGSEKSVVIEGLSKITEEVKIFHAGTRIEENQILTNGGRVLCVTGLGKNLEEAQKLAYSEVQKIHFEGMRYRKDIGNVYG